MTGAGAVRVFRSTEHPGGASPALVYGRALVRPIGACMLPVMIGALLAVLEGAAALPWLVAGFPAALVTAMLWTHLRLRTTPAEVQVVPGGAALRSVWECARDLPARTARILDLRTTPDALLVTLDYTSYALPYRAWPDHEALLSALQEARRASP
ncbi:MAG: hypothetical protein KatS3mg044_0012 [Rhodothermaceae bacterium]|nr:MAG: hypothetical protein D6746_00860 [Bacteroidota bacterium]GIV61146.1 MAG: hypothetical protein KatS3mg044_0012 [Rhodothermaceae bacterium]